MLPASTVSHTLEAALQTGADFAELYIEQTKQNRIVTQNGDVEIANSALDYGAGLRVCFGTRVLYAYTNDTSESSLVALAKQTVSAMKGSRLHRIPYFVMQRYSNVHPIQICPTTIPKKQKLVPLQQATATAFAHHTNIKMVQATFFDIQQSVLIANTEGVWAEDTRTRSRFMIETTARSETEQQHARLSSGGSIGFELFDTIDVDHIAQKSATIATTMLHARTCPACCMPVVIENGFGGVIFHEACGHGLEATAVARNASVFAGKLGEEIASPLVTAIDDGTIKNGWGSSAIDDEGTPTRKNILIERGVLRSYMVDHINGKKMNLATTGNARRQNYRFAPTSRMTNTYIANGTDTPEQIIKDTRLGLYAKQMGGGSVNPATGIFNFAVMEAYLIRNGEICEPVRGATLIGKGADVIRNIDRVGNNLSRAQGMCGSISGSIPTDVGQPTIRVSSLTIGGGEVRT